MMVSRLQTRSLSLFTLTLALSFQSIFCVTNDFFYQTSSKQPHIVLILADDLGWNDVGFHGSDEISTPNIDALAYNGVILQRHYSMPTCTPSRAALLTGRYPIRYGMQGTPIPAGSKLGIPLNETLLPQYLKRLGYKTSLVGKWHVGCYREDLLPNHRGFDSFFGYYNGYIGYYDGMHVDESTSAFKVWHRRSGRTQGDSPAWHELVGNYATHVLTSEATDVIARHNQSEPLFLEVSHLAPHSGNRGARLQVANLERTNHEFAYIQDNSRRLYAGMVKELDNSVGDIIVALDKAKMLEDSIIVFLSDNGAPTVETVWSTANSGSNWPLRGEKASLHEGGIRTVGAIWSTRIARSSKIYNENFHLVDWLPTLYAAAGLGRVGPETKIAFFPCTLVLTVEANTARSHINSFREVDYQNHRLMDFFSVFIMGGDANNLTGIDGINHWESISGLEQSQELMKPNRTLLLNIDDKLGESALMYGKWKIMKHSANILSFANAYFGYEGTGPNIPHYNLTSVLESQAGKILSKLNPDAGTKMADTFLQLRTQSTISCPNSNRTINPDNECYKSECLYDLETDPCENENVIDRFPELGKSMKSMLESFEPDIRRRPPYDFDEASHPKHFNNYWAVWVDTKNSDNGSTNLSQNILVVVLGVLCVLSYR
ncbi:arylsulfatase G [Nilaparvata lugens]|uniref:arylsulfatase G n=1 Tax=Nilaparvata lugens TaxID=108931 RepID=UPI00193C90B9|nr:arylsulfatase G [Nilaparvata lugens]